MRIYDITLAVTNDMPVWPGDPSVHIERVLRMEDGQVCNVSAMQMGVHTGTHLDAPYHFIADGNTVETLPLEVLNGPAVVVSIPNAGLLTAEVLAAAGIPPRTRRLLLKTRNSAHWAAGNKTFQKDFVAISPDGAQYLVKRGIRLVGVDYLSVAPFDDGVPTHRALLGAGVIAVEGLNLSQVEPGRYTLHCLPLKLAGADGAPARVILVGR